MDAHPDIIDKSELCKRLGWSRPTLDKRLKRDGGFPVLRVGGHGAGYQFSYAAVEAHLGGVKSADDVKPDVNTAMKVASGPRQSAHHAGEATARQRKDNADAALREDKLRELRGELVQKADVARAVTAVMGQLGQSLDAVPEKLAKALERDDLAPLIRQMMDEIRTEMVKAAEPLVAPAGQS